MNGSQRPATDGQTRRPGRRHFLRYAGGLALGGTAALYWATSGHDAPGGASSPLAVAATAAKPRALAPTFLGYNAVTAFSGVRWSNSSLLRALAELKPQTLRYPGGTVANYWDWRQGWFVRGAQVPPNWYNLPPAPAPLEDFKLAIKASGATPVFVLNMLTSTLDAQLAMLRHARWLGLPVALVELGNEFYLNAPDYAAAFPTGQDYGREAGRWAVAIRQEFPAAKIAAVGRVAETATTGVNRRGAGWTTGVLATLHGADALTFHVYPRSGLASTTTTVTAADVPTVLDGPFAGWTTMLAPTLGALPPRMEAWITEYNLAAEAARLAPLQGTWLHGLYVAALTLLYLADRRITVVTLHALLGGAGFGALFEGHHGFAGPASAERPLTRPFARTASGVVLGLLGEALRGMTSAQQLAFRPSPTLRGAQLRGAQMPAYPALLGWLFTRGRRRHAVVLNLSGTSQQVALGSVLSHDGRFEQAAASPLTLVTGYTPLTTYKGKVPDRLTLRPYSATHLYA